MKSPRQKSYIRQADRGIPFVSIAKSDEWDIGQIPRRRCLVGVKKFKGISDDNRCYDVNQRPLGGNFG